MELALILGNLGVGALNFYLGKSSLRMGRFGWGTTRLIVAGGCWAVSFSGLVRVIG